MPLTRLGTNLSPDSREALVRAAADDGVSVPVWVARLVEEELRRRGRLPAAAGQALRPDQLNAENDG